MRNVLGRRRFSPEPLEEPAEEHSGQPIQSVERLPQIPREMGAQKTMQCCQMPSFVSGLDIGKVSQDPTNPSSATGQAVRRLVHSRSQGTGLLLNDRAPSRSQSRFYPSLLFSVQDLGVVSSYFRCMDARIADCQACMI
eukprot:s1423_g2.t1